MSCFLEDNEGRIRAVLAFKREQLMYDVKNYCFIEGSLLPAESAPHVRHTIQDVGEEGNRDRVARILDLNVAKCREVLYPYTKYEVCTPYLEDRLKAQREYGIVLDLPKKVSQTTLNLLERLIHEYLVTECVADWLSITNPEKAVIWKGKAADALGEVKVCLHSRIGGVRRRMHPF
ncbi:MAG: hypothetical protein K2M56_09620 [Muribaculaceae bacterium]|nr:hypothetical protein [Muribaculaceae bacterium]